VDEPTGPGTEVASSLERRRRIRSAVAGAVTTIVVVIGGLVVVADDGPAASIAATSSSTPRPSSSTSPSGASGRLSAPKRLSIDRGVTTVHLAWDPPAGTDPAAVDHYEVFRDGKRVGRSTRPRYDVTGLTFGTRYR
jgi:hypothetical protein